MPTPLEGWGWLVVAVIVRLSETLVTVAGTLTWLPAASFLPFLLWLIRFFPARLAGSK